MCEEKLSDLIHGWRQTGYLFCPLQVWLLSISQNHGTRVANAAKELSRVSL